MQPLLAVYCTARVNRMKSKTPSISMTERDQNCVTTAHSHSVLGEEIQSQKREGKRGQLEFEAFGKMAAVWLSCRGRKSKQVRADDRIRYEWTEENELKKSKGDSISFYHRHSPQRYSPSPAKAAAAFRPIHSRRACSRHL